MVSGAGRRVTRRSRTAPRGPGGERVRVQPVGDRPGRRLDSRSPSCARRPASSLSATWRSSRVRQAVSRATMVARHSLISPGAQGGHRRGHLVHQRLREPDQARAPVRGLPPGQRDLRARLPCPGRARARPPPAAARAGRPRSPRSAPPARPRPPTSAPPAPGSARSAPRHPPPDRGGPAGRPSRPAWRWPAPRAPGSGDGITAAPASARFEHVFDSRPRDRQPTTRFPPVVARSVRPTREARAAAREGPAAAATTSRRPARRRA